MAAPPEYLLAPRVVLVAGGERRQDSVANGFDVVPAAADIVLVHDAARPLVDRGTILRAVAAAQEHGAAIVAIPASDTVKWAPSPTAGAVRFIEQTMARDAVFLAQTPQAFRRSVLAEAVALGPGWHRSHRRGRVGRGGGAPRALVEGTRRNIKVTTPDDLVIAEALVQRTSDGEASQAGTIVRVGSGYDLHRLVEGRPLVLGGEPIPFDRGLAGHSDADVLSHAITDAILGAAALGDIGQHFPDTDPRWKDASSIVMLARVAALARERGFAIANVDATVIAERPKLGPHRTAIVSRLSDALCVSPGAISVKAKTNEGMDAIGRGEAIAVHAVVLLEQRTAVSQQQAADHEMTR